jgi:mannose-6-phosphate isomerase-like protein (cupin superfamily)
MAPKIFAAATVALALATPALAQTQERIAQVPATGARVQEGAAVATAKTFTSSEEVQRLIAHAREIHKAEPTIIQPILSLAPYRASLEYRTATGPAAVHEKEAELFYVIDGSGTLTTGGKLKDEKRTNPTNLSGTGIDGGMSRTVSKGDFLIVPEGAPHQYSDIKGELILMSLHVPRG